jgi:hypothetical protein
VGATLPNFVIIGAQRCATRWLRTNLIEHPDVFMPPFDVSYFDQGNRIRRGGEPWYRNQFAARERERCVGESTPGYLLPMNRPWEVAAHMHELLPDLRLVMMVRQPVDRMYSALFHEIRKGRLDASSDLFGMVTAGHPDIDALNLVSAGLYGQNLYPFWKRFGDQILLVLQDDVRTQPEKVYEDVLRHIGAPTGFVPNHLDTVLFSNRRTVRFSGPRPTHDQLCTLYNLYRDDVAELESMVGMDLTRWDPGPPAPR